MDSTIDRDCPKRVLEWYLACSKSLKPADRLLFEGVSDDYEFRLLFAADEFGDLDLPEKILKTIASQAAKSTNILSKGLTGFKWM